ncbi:MAG: LPS assembly lipoprotein LptE [Phycisphaerales bacterium]
MIVDVLRRSAPLCCFAALLLCCFSCASDPADGYSFKSTYAEDVRSVAVPIVENRTFTKGLEVRLTEAIIKEIQRSTPWVVTSRDRADAVFAGAITDSRLRAMSIARGTGLVLEQAVELSVDFDLRLARSGRVLVSRRSFDGVASFVPSRGTGERIELGEAAAVQELARDIVAELRSNW